MPGGARTAGPFALRSSEMPGEVAGQVGVIGYKGDIDEWRNSPLPANVLLGHHNAIAGRDCWSKAERIYVIGRPQPREQEVERIAEALTGAAIGIKAGRYLKATRQTVCTNGKTHHADLVSHPDELAEAVRWAICEGSVMQAIGRARAVNRTAGNPVEIVILTNRLLPIRLDGVVTERDLKPTMADQMMADAGVAFSNLTDAAKAYPDLWPSREATKAAFRREGSRLGTFTVGESPHGKSTQPLMTATYHLAGPGKSPAQLVFDPAVILPEGLRPWLEERLGPLGRLEIDPPPIRPVQAVQKPPPEPVEVPATEERLKVWQVNTAVFRYFYPRPTLAVGTGRGRRPWRSMLAEWDGSRPDTRWTSIWYLPAIRRTGRRSTRGQSSGRWAFTYHRRTRRRPTMNNLQPIADLRRVPPACA